MNEFVYIVRDGWEREKERKSKIKVPACVELNSSSIIISCYFFVNGIFCISTIDSGFPSRGISLSYTLMLTKENFLLEKFSSYFQHCHVSVANIWIPMTTVVKKNALFYCMIFCIFKLFKIFSFSTLFHLSSFFLEVICHYYILEVVQESCIYNY